MSGSATASAIVIVLLGAVLGSLPSAAQGSAAGNKTIWDGVYSEAQATRGRAAYERSCGGCHRDDLSGGAEGEPPLKGPTFAASWKDTPLSELFITTSGRMPRTAPNSLTPDTYVDIISFLLKRNDAPAGVNDLPADTAALEQILITDPPTH